jgi:hypothetical protein
VQQVEKKVIRKEKVQKETFELLNGEKILESSESSDEETITVIKVAEETTPHGICLGIVDELINLVVDSIQDISFEDESPKNRLATVAGG